MQSSSRVELPLKAEALTLTTEPLRAHLERSFGHLNVTYSELGVPVLSVVPHPARHDGGRRRRTSLPVMKMKLVIRQREGDEVDLGRQEISDRISTPKRRARLGFVLWE